jgi:hypothetical protein
MNVRVPAAVTAAALASVAFLVPSPAAAEKLPIEFKAAFEQTFRPNHTFAVVMQEGLPTTSIYGIEGKTTAAHYSVDVVEGRWRTSEGLFDTNQRAVDFLNKGEVMELASMAWKDNRVDLRMVSVEAHRVTRGNWLLKDTKREPVATNFKFFFPFRVTGSAEAAKAVAYIEQFLRPFPSEAAARSYAGRVAAGESGRDGGRESVASVGSAAPLPAGGTAKKDLKVGMTPLEVIDVLGKPQKEVSFENKIRWTYPDMTILFENGRVKEVKF